MAEKSLYQERISSVWTSALFIFLSTIFLFLFIWCMRSGSSHFLCFGFFFFFILFLFYTVNYRILSILITPKSLILKFGIFTWTIPLDNVAEFHLDDLPNLMRYGGAGIHCMFIRKRYRASYNFLEYPRIVIVLKSKFGIVQDISFSTRQPDKVIRILESILTFRSTR
jgi:hypothetical protein